uniref:Pentatricopeptide repeat-containing protein At1g06710 n=1 Tax=Rhizophora mucronata TaxID=61149 RepID=A0A2P2JF65_RHIMU
MAVELFKELISFASDSAANWNMCISLIESLSLAHKVDKAFELYVDMIRRDSIPEMGTVFHLIKGLLRVNRWDEALQLSDSICQMDIDWVQEGEAADKRKSRL